MSTCTLVFEMEGGGKALYDAQGERITETYGDSISVAEIVYEHGCTTLTIREAITEGPASAPLYQCYSGEYGGQGECDLEWPKTLDEAWLK